MEERIAMSELDGASPKDMAEFQRKYVDTHTEIKAKSAIETIHKGRNSSLKSHEDKNAKRVGHYKKPIERYCSAENQRKVSGYLVDALDVRHKEILNKHDYPIKDLVNALIKMNPVQIEGNVEHNMTFADMVKSVTLEKKNYKTIEAD